MKILFLHEVGYLEKPIFEMHEFPEHLAARGHEVAFADYVETQRRGHNPNFGTFIQGRVRNDLRLRLFSQSIGSHSILGRLIAVIQFPFFFLSVLREFKPDLVVSFSVPTSGWQALAICKVRNIPYVFRALDVSHRIRRTAFSPLVKLAERFIYRSATWVSCNNPALREYCLALGAKKDKSSVELPPLDLSHFLGSVEQRHRLRAKLGIPPEAVAIVYMGSFFYFSGLDQVIRDLQRMESRPHLVLVGGGEQEAELRGLVQSLRLKDSVHFTGFVSFDDLPAYLSVADVAINSMVPTLVANAALPNKVLQYMAMGIPVVSTNLKGLASMFPEVDGLIFVPSPEEVLSRAVSVAFESQTTKAGLVNREMVSKTFSIEKNLDSFEQLLIRIGSSR